MWQAYKKGFKSFLQLEKSLSENSVEAYLRDVEKFTDYLQGSGNMKDPAGVQRNDLEKFIHFIAELGISDTSQARIISGLRAFYKYCFTENIVTVDPTALLETPKIKRKLPDVLSFEEIEKIFLIAVEI